MTTNVDVCKPSKVWRTIRGEAGNYKVAFYQSKENRDAAAVKWANKDQSTVLCEEWTEDTARTADPINAGWATDKTVEPTCMPGSCGAPVHEKTGYCTTHQHVYRQENGMPEPVRKKPVNPRTPEEEAEDLRSAIRMWFTNNPASFGITPTDEQLFDGPMSIVAIEGWENFSELNYCDRAIIGLYTPVLTTPSIDGSQDETMDWHVMPTVLFDVLQWNYEEYGLDLLDEYSVGFDSGTPTVEQVQAHADAMRV